MRTKGTARGRRRALYRQKLKAKTSVEFSIVCREFRAERVLHSDMRGHFPRNNVKCTVRIPDFEISKITNFSEV